MVKKGAKHKGVQLQAFKLDLATSGLIPEADIDLIEKITWDQFEKYSVVEDPKVPEFEQNALEKMIDTGSEIKVQQMLDLPTSLIDDDLREIEEDQGLILSDDQIFVKI